MARDFTLNIPNTAKQETDARQVIHLAHYAHSYLNTLIDAQ